MIEDFAKLIPEQLKHLRGEAFRSGRKAFAEPRDLYILDYHPGGDDPDTIGDHTNRVLETKQDDWASWVDGHWGHDKGEHPTQKRMQFLFERIDRDPRAVPAGLLIFQRSNKDLSNNEMREQAKPCWDFHEAVIRTLQVKVVVCLGVNVSIFVSKKLRARPTDDNFTEKSRSWTSRTYKSTCGLYVVSLTNPKRSADWRKEKDGPIGLVQRALEKVC